jgi:tRNA threonylcarbamoyl adenosine modification protein YeaZ
MNRVLGFDVSNHTCSVAVSVGDDILSYEEELRPSMQAEKVVVMIEAVLKSAGFGYKDLEYLALTSGPGSFTGIRIGLAVAKGILMSSKNIKGLAITNFDMAYFRTLPQVKSWDKIFILLDAYRGQVYFQEFNKSGIVANPQLLDIDLVPGIIKEAGENIICAGSGLMAVFDQIKDLGNVTILPRFKTIKAIHICRYAGIKIAKGLISPLEPLYIRPPDAVPQANN